MAVSRVTEITDTEEVRDGLGTLLYVEILVAVFDRDDMDPPAARVINTEKVRVTPGPGNNRTLRHLDSVTLEELESYVSNVVDFDTVLADSKGKALGRAKEREDRRKWPAELLSS